MMSSTVQNSEMVSAKKSRVDWVDGAKGIAIVLVALYHSGLLLMNANLAPDEWVEINRVFKALRMPLFFLASGLFAGSVVGRSWAGLWNSRLRLFVWMFLTWTIIRFAYFTAVPMDSRPAETSLRSLVQSPIMPTGGLWFLHALFIFFVVTKLMKQLRIPAVVQIGVATLISLYFTSGHSLHSLSYDGIADYFVFFLAGCYGRSWILIAAARPRWILTIAATALFGLMAIIIYGHHAENRPGVSFALSLVAVTTGILAARCLAATPLARGLAFLGKNTLPIYVAHVILIAALVTTISALPPLPPAVGAVLPLLVAGLAITLALLLSAALKNRAPWLYFAPGFTRIGRVTKQPSLNTP